MLVQSGRPVGVFRTHEWAPRVLIANSNLVGDWATWPEFRRLERLGPDHVRPDDRRIVDLHRYPGHPPGHVRDVRGGGRETVRWHARRHADADRRLWRDGRRPAAGGHHERRCLPGHRCRPAPAGAPGGQPVPRHGRVHCGRSGGAGGARPRRSAGRCRSGWSATPRRSCRSCWPAGYRSTSSPTRPRPTTRCPTYRRASIPTTRRTTRPQKPEEFTDRARASMARHVEAMVGFLDAGAEVFDYGNSIRGEAQLGGYSPGVRLPRLRAGLHPAAVLRGQGAVPLGGALRRPGRHRRHRPGGAGTVPGERVAAPVDPAGRRAGRVPGTAGPDLLARLRRTGQGRAALQRDGRRR